MNGGHVAALVVLAAVPVASFAYVLLGAVLVRRVSLPPGESDEVLPPVTLLRPVKSGVPRLREKLDGLARSMRAGDQLILGADAGSPEAAICGQVRDDFPEREITVTHCQPGAALNPKVSKLVQMEPAALRDHWILSDSELILEAGWLDAFRREWLATGADALTAGYRFVGMSTAIQRLDALPVLVTLWPGLLLVQRFGRLDFTLGACTGFRRADVLGEGGWSAFGDFLAEDNRLGAALVASGRTIRLSRQVATLESDPMSRREYWRHQRRVAVTYRVSNPRGFAGMVFTHGPTASLLLLLAVPRELLPPAFLWIAGWHLARWCAARHLAKSLRFPVPQLGSVMLIAGWVESACWVLSWFSRGVHWGRDFWRVNRAGKLTRRPVSKIS